MSVIGSNILAGASGQGGGYNLSRSLRFRSSASAYLSRTPASAGNRKTWTWSGWVKKSDISSTNIVLFSAASTGGSLQNRFLIALSDGSYGQQLFVGQDNGGTFTYYRVCSQVLRDPSAYYHILVALDTTQATGSNRVKVYINGSQVTSFSASNDPTQNSDLFVNNNIIHNIGRDGGANSRYFDGYLTEVNFIDGQALTPSSFGETSATTGVWQPKRYSGTYGTNGFYLPFTDNSVLPYQGTFNGSAKLAVAANTAFDLGNAWCVEAWVNPSTVSGDKTVIGRWYGADPDDWLLFISGSSLVGGCLAGSEYATSTPSGSIVANAWQHIAMTWDGTTKRLFVNGKVLATSTGSNNIGASSLGLTIGDNTSGGAPFSGAMSNVRVVKGSAVYTANFTPSTANLTAITGTQLLTLQGSSIVDNSSNAFTITNTSVTTSVPTSFASIGSDSSGNGNTWSAVSISSASGSTYDSMTDVPTLTSATASNFCVINPLYLRTLRPTISYANLRISTSSAGDSYFAGTMGTGTSGKYYYEMTYTSAGNGILVGATNDVSGGSANSGTYRSNTGVIYNLDGTTATTGASYTTGDVIGIAIDITNGTTTFYKNNSSQGSFSFTAGTELFVYGRTNGTGSETADFNFGQRPFAYTPPTGYVALNTYNLPTPTIGATASSQANKYMDVSLWSGNSSTQTITNSGSMQPDFVWMKARSTSYDNTLQDSLRGTTKYLFSNTTAAEGTTSNLITSFNSNGFTMGDSGNINQSGQTYVGWQWKANGTGVTNTAGSITSTVSANTTSGFSVVTYTGNGSAGATIGHGLGVAPKWVIVKARDGARSWNIYTESLGNTKAIYLNLTNAADTNILFWNNTSPTSSVFTVGSGGDMNANGVPFVAYCFAPVSGYSAFGSYTGNGSSDGIFTYLGFKPRFLMIKNSSSTGSWIMYDTARDTYNVVDLILSAESSGSEGSGSPYADIDFTSNGFKIHGISSAINTNGNTYVYAAFAEHPFKYSLGR